MRPSYEISSQEEGIRHKDQLNCEVCKYEVSSTQ